MKKKHWKDHRSLRVTVGILLIFGWLFWLITPIPGSTVALISGLYLINEEWAKKKIQYFRNKFRK